jgi:cytoskeletal protein CcmA (bactofilin family)
MFDRRNPQAPTAPTARPLPPVSMDSREKSNAQLLSIVGPDARIEGRFEIADSIQIECEIGGELEVGGRLVIGTNGIVHADVQTVDAVIMGHFEGRLVATGNVEITETGQVSGNIQTDSLVISKGGSFNGNVIKMTTGPSAQTHTPTQAPTISLGDRRPSQVAQTPPSIGRYEPPAKAEAAASDEESDNDSVATPLVGHNRQNNRGNNGNGSNNGNDVARL